MPGFRCRANLIRPARHIDLPRRRVRGEETFRFRPGKGRDRDLHQVEVVEPTTLLLGQSHDPCLRLR